MRFPLSLGLIGFAALAAAPASAFDGVGIVEDGVAAANQDAGTPAIVIDPDFRMKLVATGTDPLENPSGIITTFGRLNDGKENDKKGTLTHPDENLYLVLPHNPGGPESGYDYGRHFLFQGHENGAPMAYITRVNLDVPRGDKHRITLLTPPTIPDPSDPTNVSKFTTGFGSIDGSTYDPFTNTLLFTQERGNGGAPIQVTLNWPPKVNTLDAFLGRAGYEGIHPDDKGNIFIVEDSGGARNPTTQAAQPNSFVYRFVPNDPSKIEAGGKLQALQVIIDGLPLVFGGTANRDNDIMAPVQIKLHTPGTSYPIKWVTIHTSNVGDSASFDANAAAKAANATPLKRPENMAWLPGSDFRTFFFDTTGDTNLLAGAVPELAARGAWGAIWRVDLLEDKEFFHHQKPQDDGAISLFFLGDQTHNSFDNLAFANARQLLAAEDRGDGLHGQLNTLDSIWAFDVRQKHPKPLRFLAMGRDATSLTNGENNEPTGVFVSNGSPTKHGLLGTEDSIDNARGFLTQQHGDDNVFTFFRVRPPFFWAWNYPFFFDRDRD